MWAEGSFSPLLPAPTPAGWCWVEHVISPYRHWAKTEVGGSSPLPGESVLEIWLEGKEWRPRGVFEPCWDDCMRGNSLSTHAKNMQWTCNIHKQNMKMIHAKSSTLSTLLMQQISQTTVTSEPTHRILVVVRYSAVIICVTCHEHPRQLLSLLTFICSLVWQLFVLIALHD